MDRKKMYICKLASFLYKQGKVMSGKELADHLNRNGFSTSYGTPYRGGRGTYKLIKQTWKQLRSESRDIDAEYVALAYVKRNGAYAYS